MQTSNILTRDRAVWVKGLQDSEELDDLEYQDSEVGSVVGVREGHDEDGENK